MQPWTSQAKHLKYYYKIRSISGETGQTFHRLRGNLQEQKAGKILE